MTRPLFERRHYEAIARILYESRVYKPYWTGLVEDFVEVFEADNSNFKRELFMKAVGPHE